MILRTSAALFLVATGLAAQISLTHIGSIDVSTTSNASNPEFIGSNPSAVAWDGTDLWLAGFNNTNAAADVAIIKLSNALSSPTYGARFGLQPSTTMSRGYSGLDVAGVVVAAAYDAGYSVPAGISVWATGGPWLWNKQAAGASGVAFDPGFVGAGQGVAWTYIGSGRRLLQNSFSGADIYTPSDGMFIIAGIGAFWRDIDFDSLTGDVYLRKGNQVLKVERLGANTTAIAQVLVPTSQFDFIPVQNLAFVRQPDKQFIIWNDRRSTVLSKPFATSVLASSASDGSPVSLDFGSFSAPAGSGAYDFSYDEASATLAICDFENRAVHVFAVSSFQQYGSGCSGAGGFVPQLAAQGDTRPGGSITYEISDAAPLSLGLFVLGTTQASTVLPLPFSPNCPLLVAPAAFLTGTFVTSAVGLAQARDR